MGLRDEKRGRGNTLSTNRRSRRETGSPETRNSKAKYTYRLRYDGATATATTAAAAAAGMLLALSLSSKYLLWGAE